MKSRWGISWHEISEGDFRTAIPGCVVASKLDPLNKVARRKRAMPTTRASVAEAVGKGRIPPHTK